MSAPLDKIAFKGNNGAVNYGFVLTVDAGSPTAMVIFDVNPDVGIYITTDAIPFDSLATNDGNLSAGKWRNLP